MKLLLPLLVVTLAGCTVVPVSRSFPPVPPELTKKCPDLGTIEQDKNKITDLLTKIVENYQLYYECAIKVDNWNTWYTEQKKIFETK